MDFAYVFPGVRGGIRRKAILQTGKNIPIQDSTGHGLA
jgi:hypothetical protein